MIAPNVHAPFRFQDAVALRKAIENLGLDIPVDEDLSCLRNKITLAGKTAPNLMAVQPMEGCDGTADGAPDALTFRRCRRFGAGGAGLLWFEACAVVREGRANPRQLWLHQGNKDGFAQMLEESLKSAANSMGTQHRPFTALQLTHSGRYSRPIGAPAPIIAHHDPILDASRGIPEDYALISDGELEALEDRFVESAKLAYEVGFDAVDIKACHRYLLNELLAAHTRGGNYGGSYENRTRLLKNIVGKIHHALGSDKIITCRMNIYDSHPYPHGWGMDPADLMAPNLDEPKRLVRELMEMGMRFINVTMGNPYFTPHINRPYDRNIQGASIPEEHPLVGVARLTGLAGEVQQHTPEMTIIGSGYSWLRHLWPYVAAANINTGRISMVGLGRQAFAYPNFAKEILETGALDPHHTCIGCSSCSQIMRDGGMAGCVPFDAEIYRPVYQKGRGN